MPTPRRRAPECRTQPEEAPIPGPLRPLDAPYEADVAAALAHYPQRDGYILTLFRTVAQSLRFLKKGAPNLLDAESPLSVRLREIVILRVTARNGCEYEWGVHARVFAKAAGLDEAALAATVHGGPDAPSWSPEEAVLIRLVDELCDRGGATAETMADAAKLWEPAQQLEIFALAGAYHTVSFVANSAALPPEDFAKRFPAA